MHRTTIKCPTCGQTIELDLEVTLNQNAITITTKTNTYNPKNKEDNYEQIFQDENNPLLADLDETGSQPVLPTHARNSLLATIKNLDKIYPEGVPIDMVREHARSKGFPDQTTDELLAQLRKRGDIIPITKNTVKPFKSILRPQTRVNHLNKTGRRVSAEMKQL